MSKKRFYRYPLYLLLKLLQWLVSICPRTFGLSLMRAVGVLAWNVLSKEREKVITNLTIAFGDEKSFEEKTKIGRVVFQNLGMTAVDALRIPTYMKQKSLNQLVIASDEVFARIKEALSRGCGLMILTGHIGNWELITAYLGALGYNGSVIGKRIYYEPFNRVLEKLREATGARVIYRDESAKAVLKVLRENKIVGILADQDVDSIDGIFVPFFSKRAYTPTAPAKISLASGAPMLPMFMIRSGDRYELVCDELIWPDGGDAARDDSVKCITEKWSQVVERIVRQYPDQWVWMHRRWKTQESVKLS